MKDSEFKMPRELKKARKLKIEQGSGEVTSVTSLRVVCGEKSCRNTHEDLEKSGKGNAFPVDA